MIIAAKVGVFFLREGMSWKIQQSSVVDFSE